MLFVVALAHLNLRVGLILHSGELGFVRKDSEIFAKKQINIKKNAPEGAN